jgi:hypothetical protein
MSYPTKIEKPEERQLTSVPSPHQLSPNLARHVTLANLKVHTLCNILATNLEIFPSNEARIFDPLTSIKDLPSEWQRSRMSAPHPLPNLEAMATCDQRGNEVDLWGKWRADENTDVVPLVASSR